MIKGSKHTKEVKIKMNESRKDLSGEFHPSRRYKVNHNFFDNINTEEKAYILGFFFADGYNSNNQYNIGFTSCDKEILCKISQAMESNYPIREIYQSPTLKSKNLNISHYHQLVISSKIMHESLLKYFPIKKSHFVFDFLKIVPKHLQRHYIRGYFDGDGSIYITKSNGYTRGVIQIASGVSGNIQNFNRFLRNEKIINNNGFVYKRKDGVCYNKIQCKTRLMKLYDLLYTNAVIFLERKQTKWFNVLKDSHYINCVEVFHSFQGEGTTVGKNMIFIRTAFCNLKCNFCDTKFSWNSGEWMSINQLRDKCIESGINNVCITGGCPLLYNKQISTLLNTHNFDRVEIETNGTVHPHVGLSNSQHFMNKKNVWFNVSPKTENSGNLKSKRYKPDIIELFARIPNSIFKFVIVDENDLNEVQKMIVKHRIPKNKIYLMAEGATKESQDKRMKEVSKIALKYGYNFSPRLQVLMYGTKRGV